MVQRQIPAIYRKWGLRSNCDSKMGMWTNTSIWPSSIKWNVLVPRVAFEIQSNITTLPSALAESLDNGLMQNETWRPLSVSFILCLNQLDCFMAKTWCQTLLKFVAFAFKMLAAVESFTGFHLASLQKKSSYKFASSNTLFYVTDWFLRPFLFKKL